MEGVVYPGKGYGARGPALSLIVRFNRPFGPGFEVQNARSSLLLSYIYK
jgi:hypothetical protein